jgi:hypothetical protein
MCHSLRFLNNLILGHLCAFAMHHVLHFKGVWISISSIDKTNSTPRLDALRIQLFKDQ